MSETLGTFRGAPIVEVSRIDRSGKVDEAIIEGCPFCGVDHFHGFDEFAEYNTLAHRAQHCEYGGDERVKNRGYWLCYTKETENFEPGDYYAR